MLQNPQHPQQQITSYKMRESFYANKVLHVRGQIGAAETKFYIERKKSERWVGAVVGRSTVR
jgi:hypothetical protein